jgi:poly(A) polymerase
MIRRLIARMRQKVVAMTQSRQRPAAPVAPVPPVGQPKHVVVGREHHNIRRESLLRGANDTCEYLQRAGFKAFIVGGAVRDLLLGIVPKDFDVATDATPEQVRGVFRRSRIIGKRFRLVHVMFGRDTIEVSTFRAHFESEADEESTDAHGRVLSDNVFGSMAEDAVRRDFTVNALFYDPVREELWDYQGGLADLKARRLRMIGDPATRYREDPVRMLRAARLSAKLGLTVEPGTLAPVAQLKSLLKNVPQARLFEEILKLLLSGHSAACIEQLRAMDLHHGLLPLLDAALDDPRTAPFAMAALKATDERLAADKTVNPAFVLAALLWGQVQKVSAQLEAEGLKPLPALHEAMHQVLDLQRDSLAVPRRFDAIIKEIWLMQPRFAVRRGGQPARMLQQPRFRAAFDFYELRAHSGDADPEIAQWWLAFQEARDDERPDLLMNDNAGSPTKKRRRGGRRRGSPNSSQGADPNTASTANSPVVDPVD